MSDKFYVTYDELQAGTLQLAEKLAKSDLITKDTQLVCISRGGLFIGGILSYALGLKSVHCVSLESYTEEKNHGNEEVRNLTPFLPTESSYASVHRQQYQWLVVDDINDTSQTYEYVIERMTELGLDFQFATTYHKKRDNNLSPDFIGVELPSDCWVVFPWDNM